MGSVPNVPNGNRLGLLVRFWHSSYNTIFGKSSARRFRRLIGVPNPVYSHTYDLPSVAALISYFLAVSGYLVQSTWLKSISAWNYSLWPGLTLDKATKYFPSADAIIMGHLVQKRQGVRSTKPKPPTTSSPEYPIPRIRSNELFLQVAPISKLYTDDTVRFPIHSHSGNQCIMILCHCDADLY